MSTLGILLVLVAGALTIALPRTYALIPLLLTAAYLPATEALDIGGATFTAPRLLVAIGFLRMLVRREDLHGRWSRLDVLVLLWGAILLVTSAFHTPDAWLFRLGMVWTQLGTYFIARRLLRSEEDVVQMIRALAICLLPLAALMVFEKATDTNPLSVFQGVSAISETRENSVRATGPFSHPILAGTVGAVLFGMGAALWRESRISSVLACAGGAAIVYASASSGPLLMAASIVLARLVFPWRHGMRTFQVVAILCIVALDLVMNDPVYFLMARIDLVGGSQGYFRAQLIRSAIEHLSEWWLAGTDVTRHWMPTGLKVNGEHTDMTNHILWMGVLGGLPLMLSFLSILVQSFAAIGKVVRSRQAQPASGVLLVWTLGCVLFGITVNFMSISMFDQSVVFFWLVVALIASAAGLESKSVEAFEESGTKGLLMTAPRRFDWQDQ